MIYRCNSLTLRVLSALKLGACARNVQAEFQFQSIAPPIARKSLAKVMKKFQVCKHRGEKVWRRLAHQVVGLAHQVVGVLLIIEWWGCSSSGRAHRQVAVKSATLISKKMLKSVLGVLDWRKSASGSVSSGGVPSG